MSDNTTESERSFTIEDMRRAFCFGSICEMHSKIGSVATHEGNPHFYKWLEDYTDKKANDSEKGKASGVSR